MKNVSVALNVVLILAVGYLYYHSFAGNKKGNSNSSAPAIKDSMCKINGRVAYFNMDSVENSFDYYKQEKAKFDKQKEDANARLESMQKSYNARLMDLQQHITTQADQEKASQELSGLQQKMQAEKSRIDNELYGYGNSLNEDILSKINVFLKEYNTPKKWDYIMQFEPRLIYYKDSTLNITTDLVNGLNSRYKKSKQ
ncbi:MAG: OmpH family outer membrane protein [Ferruginibacter sp.]